MAATHRLRRSNIPDGQVARLVDGALGIVRNLSDVHQDPSSPAIFLAAAQSADTSLYFPGAANNQNSGAGFTWRDARMAAVGEAIERYCSAAYDPETLQFGSFDQLSQKSRCVSPEVLQIYADHQTEALARFAPFLPKTPIAWVQGHSLTRGENCLLPAGMVLLPYVAQFRERGERNIGRSYSTGLSAGSGVAESLYYGLCEVIERDAFMNLWLNRLPVPRVHLHSDPELAGLFDSVFARDGLEYVVVDATTDVGVPALFCLLFDHAYDPPLVSVGGACRLSAVDAARKALLEAAHTAVWARSLRREKRIYRADFADVESFDDHVAIHASGQIRESLEFLRQSPRSCELAALPDVPAAGYADAVGIVTQRLAQLGIEAYAVDLTTDDVAELGIHVTRAFIPALIPLHAGHALRPLGSRRLYELPQRMGYDVRLRTVSDMNPYPHPFP